CSGCSSALARGIRVIARVPFSSGKDSSTVVNTAVRRYRALPKPLAHVLALTGSTRAPGLASFQTRNRNSSLAFDCKLFRFRVADSSLGHDSRVVVRGPRSLEHGDGNLLVAPGTDATVVEMHHAGLAVNAGDHHEVVCSVPLPGPVPDCFGIEDDDDLVVSPQLARHGGGIGLNVVGSDPVVPQQYRKVGDIGGARWLPNRLVTRCARCVFGQSDHLLFGWLASRNLADHIGHRHFPTVGSVLFAPVGRGGHGIAIHSQLMV